MGLPSGSLFFYSECFGYWGADFLPKFTDGNFLVDCRYKLKAVIEFWPVPADHDCNAEISGQATLSLFALPLY